MIPQPARTCYVWVYILYIVVGATVKCLLEEPIQGIIAASEPEPRSTRD